MKIIINIAFNTPINVSNITIVQFNVCQDSKSDCSILEKPIVYKMASE